MALMPRLEIRQAQSLTLTPQLMQSIRLLQLSHLELNAFVETELERNPLLERDEVSDSEPLTTPEYVTEGSPDRDTVDHGETMGSASSIAEQYDTDVSNVFPEQVGQDSVAQSLNKHREGPSMIGLGEAPDIDSYVASQISLADHLREQINLILKQPAERLIAQHLIDNLNEAGYMMAACDDIAAQLGATESDVEAVLQRVQGCDPLGVFGRNLSECLAIQLREKDRLDPMMQALLDNLDLVAMHDMTALTRATGADRDDIADMLGELRELDPKPGRAFDGGPVQAVVPDVFVRRGNTGLWEIELNTEVLPRVLVNRTYYASVTRKARNPGEKTFLTDCLQTANWLTKSLDQRAQTILKVAAEIVRQQDAFLEHGIAHLKPMTLKAVAEEIDMHESTVSRVTSNKYLATPRGLFEMKYFFTTALGSTTGGADHSAEAVRHRIRQLIEAESPKAILSDDTIAEMLKAEQGIDVARRTVAKYREGMNIPSSVIRRRQKKAMTHMA
ncbi:RNA polymerase factor sigma-54 [Mariluticola halotolerans]|uniref:RNA polymerase factor sigma-54 n=1 Tax=Mariluticola halotolerans TaxID=2909283 RepID=UPI0026E30DAF|nr:RNA polymerase factor sigma-54 [Mariluticola halotolerans]UJQ93297.1 RNA polymerase factor sigma-54 [Mariluticola halotolerans]